MPDPTGKTISATQIPALFDASPYLTKWLLWRHFKHGDNIDVDANDRMDWGTRLEPVIFQAVCEELNLDGEHHAAQTYFRHEELPIGCTPDGTIHDLNLGPGAVECKNVDWLRWKDGWTETEAPAHIEMQIQAQMLVRNQRWGVIACLVGGNDLRIYRREPDAKLQKRMASEVADFFASLAAGDEPDPLAAEMEMPLWRETRDLDADLPPLDLRDRRDAADLLAELRYWTEQEKMARTSRDSRRRALEVLAGDHSTVLAWGHTAYLKRSQTKPSEIMLPADLRDALAAILEAGDWNEETVSALTAAMNWSTITRRGGVRVSIDIRKREEDGEAPWLGDDLEFAP